MDVDPELYLSKLSELIDRGKGSIVAVRATSPPFNACGLSLIESCSLVPRTLRSANVVWVSLTQQYLAPPPCSARPIFSRLINRIDPVS